MNLTQLKALSQKRILNMKHVYEQAGLPPSSMNSRLSKMSGQLSVEEAEALELATIEQIGQIIDTLDLNKFALANYLNLRLHEDTLKEGVGGSVQPFGYWHRGDKPIPVFEHKDKLRQRVIMKGAGQPMYYDLEKIRNFVESPFFYSGRFKPTDRGKQLVIDA